MIEFMTDNNGELVVINPSQICYIRNDDGTAIIKLVTNEQFIVEDYNEVIARLQESSMVIYLDKEARESQEEAVIAEAE